MFIYLFQKLAAKLLRFLQDPAALCNFLFLHIDILLFLPQKSIIYVTKEYKATINLSAICFQNVIFKKSTSNSGNILNIYIICQPYTIPAEVKFVTVFCHLIGIND